MVGIFWQNSIYYLIISVVGAILFSAYLLYDIQARRGCMALHDCTLEMSTGMAVGAVHACLQIWECRVCSVTAVMLRLVTACAKSLAAITVVVQLSLEQVGRVVSQPGCTTNQHSVFMQAVIAHQFWAMTFCRPASAC